jgi:signal transduction histidine kinase
MSPAPTEIERFEVDSALLSEIGEKLVTTPHVALTELVKNAYDADATEVHVSICLGESKKPIVKVSDNGHGMTRDAVHRYWMRIGTTNKIEEEVSPRFGRRRTGAKGIGRFACRRLGRMLTVETCAKIPENIRTQTNEQFERTHLVFDWDEFVPGSNVSEVRVKAQSERLDTGSTGLSLSISNARQDEWSFRGYAYLKRQLAALCANQGYRRKGYQEDPGFRVFLSAPGLEEDGETEDLREQLMNAGWGTLTGRLTREGRAVCTLVARGVGKRTITSTHPFAHLRDVTIRLAIFPFEREWLRNTNVVSQTTTKELCDEWGGVQVRFRGFRVYPYGDEEDDWLAIERDRARRLGKPSAQEIFDYAQTLDGVNGTRALLNMLSMRSYLGAVEIGNEQPGLEPKADRMGFVENEVFRELKEYVRFAVDWAMVLRDYAVQLKETKNREELRRKLVEKHGRVLSADDSPSEAIKILRVAIKRVSDFVPDKNRSDVKLLDDATSYLESTLKITTRDLLRLRLVASASTLTLLFAHEIKGLTSTFASIGKELSRVADSFPTGLRRRLHSLGNQVSESEKNLSELLELTSSLGVLDRDAKPIRLDLLDSAKRAKSRFERIRQRYGIDIDIDEIPEGLQVGPMLEGELLAILINVLSNSIKSVIAAGGKKTIMLKAERSAKHVRLDVLDSGIGISSDSFEEVFTPMVSDPTGALYQRLEQRLNPEDKVLLGGGTGLGLSIVRGILQARNGSAELFHPSAGWKFHLRLVLP